MTATITDHDRTTATRAAADLLNRHDLSQNLPVPNHLMISLAWALSWLGMTEGFETTLMQQLRLAWITDEMGNPMLIQDKD